MAEKIQITSTKGDDTGKIDQLIHFLLSAKEQGATHYRMSWSNDPMWAFKWFETYKVESDDESEGVIDKP